MGCDRRLLQASIAGAFVSLSKLLLLSKDMDMSNALAARRMMPLPVLQARGAMIGGIGSGSEVTSHSLRITHAISFDKSNSFDNETNAPAMEACNSRRSQPMS